MGVIASCVAGQSMGVAIAQCCSHARDLRGEAIAEKAHYESG